MKRFAFTYHLTFHKIDRTIRLFKVMFPEYTADLLEMLAGPPFG
jgi:hypothetical protein